MSIKTLATTAPVGKKRDRFGFGRVSPRGNSRSVGFVWVLAACLALVGLPLAAREAPVYFEHLALEEGLSQSRILAIEQDAVGFLWFGTQDGLNRYDGYEFRIYRPQVPNGDVEHGGITALAAADNGDLWVGTRQGGLFVYRAARDRFDAVTLPAEAGVLPHITALCRDGSGRLWIGTRALGLFYVPAGGPATDVAPLPVTATALAHQPAIQSLAWSGDGTLWLGSERSGLLAYQPASQGWQHWTKADGLLADTVQCLLPEADGGLWIGTQNGLMHRNGDGALRSFQPDAAVADSLSGRQIWSLLRDRAGALWVGTRDDGLNRSHDNGQTFDHFHYSPINSKSLSSNQTWRLFEDRSGVIWVGTGGQGINKYARGLSQFLRYGVFPDHPHSPGAFVPLSMTVDRDQRLWMGTWNHGLVSLDTRADRFTYHHLDSGDQKQGADSADTETKLIIAALADRDNSLWFGAYKRGLLRFDPVTGQTQRFPTAAGTTWTPTAIVDGEPGVLWVGSYRAGLYRFDKQSGEYRQFQANPQQSGALSMNQVSALLYDSRDRLWVATFGGGLNLLSPGSADFTHFRNDPARADSLPHDLVTTLHEDPHGRIWVGTDGGGLSLWQGPDAGFQRIEAAANFGNKVVNGIMTDTNGDLWVATNKGLLQRHAADESWRRFGTGEGVMLEFNAGVFAGSASGELFFGGTRGLNRFHPNALKHNRQAPPVVLTAVKKFHQDAVPGPYLVRDLAFDYTDNFLRFEFAALDFNLPEKNRYRYKLEGVDRDWVDAGTRRSADYTDLDGGRYIFRVAAGNHDGVWNEAGLAVPLVIHPPFWQTWWFQLLLVLVALVVLVALPFVWQMRRYRRLQQLREQELETKRRLTEGREVERLRIAQEIHDGPVQDLHAVHIQMVLFQKSLALKLAKLLGAEASRPSPAAGLADIVVYLQRIAQDLRDLCGQLRPPTLQHFGLNAALEAHIDRCREKYPHIEISCDTGCAIGGIPEETQLALFRICQEALNNAFQHAKGDQVWVCFEADAEALVLEVRDNGLGFEPQNLVSFSRQGHFGLLGISERAQAIGARLEIESKPDQGTMVRVFAPLVQQT